MFWTILLCHFIADYPLQTDNLVVAKKTLPGLIVHVSIHLLVSISILCGSLSLPTRYGVILALAVSLLHFVIDFWKNILSSLKPNWIIFGYVQDQILHILSIALVSFVWQQFTGINMLAIKNIIFLYAIGLLIITHVWFVTERILIPNNQHLIVATVFPRIVFRTTLYSALIFGFNLIGFVVLVSAFLVICFDLAPKQWLKWLLIDVTGVLVLMGLILALIR